ncbi:MAG: DUF423 domain-containing protein [bacterium]|jgi:uncharacterized membrane protein YgdD (TMEM256/DUF423 family)|nr:DUF423 domain-containing protein [Planctomycetota bacterium]HIL50931.1 DUF423 domain-containing protein [Planctomycetota bacterium]
MKWIAVGAFSGAITVALGALGAHSLKPTLGAEGLELWHTAAHYQGLHALALVAWGMYRRSNGGGNGVGWAFALGSLFFCGSIYGLALGYPGQILGPLTPLGGVFFLVGWLWWGLAAARASRAGS